MLVHTDLRGGDSLRSRTGGPSVTAEDHFSAAWPSIVPRLTGFLRRRGAGTAEIDDLIQDTAIRVLQARPAYDTSDDLWPWVATAARRLWIDRLRRRDQATDPR